VHFPRTTILDVHAGPVTPSLAFSGHRIESGMFKDQVDGAIAVGVDGLEGDEHADPEHGGRDRAVCVYARERYAHWEERIGRPLPPSAFGENLTTEGAVEDDVTIGDVVAVGDAVLQVTQPRTPCFRIAARYGIKDFTAWVWQTGYTGWFFRCLEPGHVRAGDEIRLLEHPGHGVTIGRLNEVAAGFAFGGPIDDAVLDAAIALPELAVAWREGLAIRRAQRAAVLHHDQG
jgi:MOSC domain-containing protein YiiM